MRKAVKTADEERDTCKKENDCLKTEHSNIESTMKQKIEELEASQKLFEKEKI